MYFVFQKAERKTSKRGSILTYTNKTLKQHWEEYIGNEDPIKVSGIYLYKDTLFTTHSDPVRRDYENVNRVHQT